MKKIISWLVILFLLVFIFIYLNIPSARNISLSAFVHCTETGASRQILYLNKWQRWWPGAKKKEGIYTFNDFDYHINKIVLNGFKTTIYHGTDSIKATFKFGYDEIDSTIFQWSTDFKFSSNPFKRYKEIRRMDKFENNIAGILNATVKYFNNEVNIYGMNVVKEQVKEAHYISTKSTFNHYPVTSEIYEMIQSLKNFIAVKGRKENGDPMLHVEKEGDNIFETLVAIPTDAELPAEGKFLPKKMILGNILKAEVKGGPFTILTGERELANYLLDYKKTSPAIPFETLVTNRMLQTDTTQWITHLYYPIFI